MANQVVAATKNPEANGETCTRFLVERRADLLIPQYAATGTDTKVQCLNTVGRSQYA
jgi:hypothetical protein